MKTRLFYALGREVSEIGLGAWQLGGTEWGPVSEEDALETLQAAAESGVTFIDTADIYGMGRSETLIGRFLQQRSDRDQFFIATKVGRRPDPGWPKNFSHEVLFQHVEDSLRRLQVETIDLVQLHCLPMDVLQQGEVFEHLRELRRQGKIKAFGASVESMAEALACLEQEGLASLQIIFNIFRRKPIDVLFEKARQKQVALIARLPLASGLLGGKLSDETAFGERDHRQFNRDGRAFNIGETFAGLPFERGVELVSYLRPLVPEGMTMAQFALRWCLDFEAITTAIPGSKRAKQVRENAAASELAPLPETIHRRLRQFYEDEVVSYIRGPY